MTVLEMARKYYPRLWSRERVEALVQAGRSWAKRRKDRNWGAGRASPQGPGAARSRPFFLVAR